MSAAQMRPDRARESERPSQSAPSRIIVRRKRRRSGWLKAVAIVLLVLVALMAVLTWQGVSDLARMSGQLGSAAQGLHQQSAQLSGIQAQLNQIGLDRRLGMAQLTDAINRLIMAVQNLKR
jgi:predicted PurR-regulated permease PerM